jgi:hypothetical protein
MFVLFLRLGFWNLLGTAMRAPPLLSFQLGLRRCAAISERLNLPLEFKRTIRTRFHPLRHPYVGFQIRFNSAYLNCAIYNNIKKCKKKMQ